ncbi:MAG: ABC transporter ATP-binding protein, partial [Actinobacteria bacterium ATB1]|nr:ABC transporter ATP-binding protein [Actinobacteria bacterium ATB1]
LGALLGWDPPPLTVKAALEHVRRSGPGEVESPPRRLSTPGETVLRATGLRVRLGGREVLSDVDVSLRSGEVVALLGRNGAGKTTLLRCLAGLLDPSRGTVEASSPVAYVPQNPNMLLSAHTARAELEATLRLLGRRDAPAVDRWLVALGLEDLAERHPRSLSVGQRQRLAVAAVAIGGARVLLLDEPTRGMDAPSRKALVDAVREHAEAGGAVMLATHDVELAARAAGRIVVIGDGEMVADGRAAETLAGSLFAPQVLRVLPPFLTVDEVASAWSSRDHGEVGR